MGHYASEMGYDSLTPEERYYHKRKSDMEKHLCKVLGVKRGELKLVYTVLKESWNIPDKEK